MMYVGRYNSRYFRVHKRNLSNVPEDFTVFTDRKAAKFYIQKTNQLNSACYGYVELKKKEDFDKFRNQANMNINLLFGFYGT
jgi:hypothetical protein